VPNCRVRVQYPDRDGLTTYWLPMLNRTSAGSKQFSLPNIGDEVHVLHFPQAQETGIVLGATFNDMNPAPQLISAGGTVSGPYSHQTIYADGTYEDYNPETSVKTLNTQGAINTVTIGPYTISSQGPITITSSGNVTINGVIVDPNGNVTVPGTLTVDGNVTFKASGTIQTHLTNQDGAGGGS
jgi:phage baseplate assembly protein V